MGRSTVIAIVNSYVKLPKGSLENAGFAHEALQVQMAEFLGGVNWKSPDFEAEQEQDAVSKQAKYLNTYIILTYLYIYISYR